MHFDIIRPEHPGTRRVVVPRPPPFNVFGHRYPQPVRVPYVREPEIEPVNIPERPQPEPEPRPPEALDAREALRTSIRLTYVLERRNAQNATLTSVLRAQLAIVVDYFFA